jgi:hypothetical protein
VSLEKILLGCQTNSPPQPPNCRFQFQKRRQLFVRVNNETLSVVAVRISNPDRAAFEIHNRHATKQALATLQPFGGYSLYEARDRLQLAIQFSLGGEI